MGLKKSSLVNISFKIIPTGLIQYKIEFKIIMLVLPIILGVLSLTSSPSRSLCSSKQSPLVVPTARRETDTKNSFWNPEQYLWKNLPRFWALQFLF